MVMELEGEVSAQEILTMVDIIRYDKKPEVLPIPSRGNRDADVRRIYSKKINGVTFKVTVSRGRKSNEDMIVTFYSDRNTGY